MSRYGGGRDRRDSFTETKLYVGDLPRDASEKDLERAFSYYGPLRNVWVARNPPGFAFIEFEDTRDADDAVRALDGSSICGGRVRVELSTGKQRQKPWQRRGGGGRGGGGGDRRDRDFGGRDSRRAFDPTDKCYECGERGHYAYDCRKNSRGSRRRSRSRSRSRSPMERGRRSYTRSRSR